MRVKVGNLSFRIIGKTEELSKKLFSMFLVEEDGESCYEIRILEEEPLEIQGKILFQDDRVQVIEGQNDLLETRVYRHPLTGEKFAQTKIYEDHSEAYFWPLEVNAEDWRYLYLMALALDKIAFFQHCFVLHSSSILVDGEMIVFSAPSGTGKSTQADLWNEFRGAKIINGDRNLLFYREGRFYVQGWILSGSSEHRHNICAPLKAVVSLEKSPDNRVSQLKGMHALRQLHREIISNFWDRECVDKEMDFLIHLLSEVPVLHLACRKDETAVDTLDNYLKSM